MVPQLFGTILFKMLMTVARSEDIALDVDDPAELLDSFILRNVKLLDLVSLSSGSNITASIFASLFELFKFSE